jgi:serine/threonine-protein kinase
LTLNPGTRLGPYEIAAPLGVGGMGEVYRARDTKLHRDVAIKVLPQSVADDPGRLARFRREAQVLASLNHPHIGAIYGVEDTDQVALVLELVDGVTLAERINHRPLAWKDALEIAIQIADGLEAAHERGIIHRDLKPANVKIASSGRAKVLDFGLAKATNEGGIDAASPPDTLAATRTLDATREGIVVGTIAYMSPEQARGQPIDRRTDVWAFGCVLFEMLCGRPAFAGKTSTDTLAAIVDREPSWQELPATVPKSVVDILRCCLAKDPKRRFRDLADVRIGLEHALAVPAASIERIPTGAWRPLAVGVVVGAIATAIGAVVVVRNMRPTSPNPTASDVKRLHIIPADGLFVDTSACTGGGVCGAESVLTISPDGHDIVYAAGRGSNEKLYLRSLDSFENRPIPGTEGGRVPVFSPDGRTLAFIADRKLKKVSLDGGAPATLREFVEGDGLSWADDGYIYFNPGLATGLWRVSEAGGEATRVTTIGDELQHHFPEVLPGGSLLYSGVGRPSGTGERVYMESAGSNQRKSLFIGAAPHYLPTGHLVYAQAGQLLAVRFDAARQVVIGTPTVVVDHVEQTLNGTPQFAVSRSGALVYVPAKGGTAESALVSVSLEGVESPTKASGRPFVQPRLAPDGHRVALALRGNTSDIWVYDLIRETTGRLTFDTLSSFPVWAPDGARLAFSSGKEGPTNIYWKSSSDGSQDETQLIPGTRANLVLSWSPEGKIAYVAVDPQTAQDIWVFDLKEKKASPFLQTPFGEGAPAFSPDGRWIAYVSNESGRNEVYVRPYPGPGEKWTISTEGGNEPVWAKNAPELFYRNGSVMMVVDVRTSPEFSAGKPRRLFDRPYDLSNAFWPDYDVTPDGRHLLMLKSVEQRTESRQIDVVLNWSEELKQRVPTR